MHGRLERRGSLASLRSFDDDRSSRPSSMSSQADYRDRISELDRERNHGREREWNKRHPPPRPSSSLSISSNNSHSHSHPPRPPSATPYRTPTLASLQRRSSRASLRSESPTSSLASSHDSLKEQEREGKEEITHERERNWNSPHPKWSTSTHHSRGSGEQEVDSPSSLGKNRSLGKGKNPLRATSSLSQLRSSNGHQDSIPTSTKQQGFRHRADSTPVTSTVDRHKLDGHSSSQLNGDDVGASEFTPQNGPSSHKTLGAASRFGWNFARSQPLPPLEFNSSPDRPVQDEPRSHSRDIPSPAFGPRPSSRASGTIKSSLIPVRPVTKSFSNASHGASDMSLTHVVGDEPSFTRGHYGGLTELSESVGRILPRVTEHSWGQEDMVLASDEESIVDFPPQSTTPKSDPPNCVPEEVETDTETEVLASPPSSPSRSWGLPQLLAAAPITDENRLQRVLGSFSRARTPDLPPEEPLSPALPVSSTPSGSPLPADSRFHLPSSDISQFFALSTPPRQTSLGNSIPNFRTPSPPRDLPELPAPPSSSDDEALRVDSTPRKDGRLSLNLNHTLMKTPKPPGAWAPTPVPGKLDPRSSSPAPSSVLESTPLTSTSTPLPRATSYPGIHFKTETAAQDGVITPVATLSRANSLPLRTPAPPGAWMATPDQPALQSVADQARFGSFGRRRSMLKVRFDVTESEASTAEGHLDLPLSAVRLINPEFPQSRSAATEPEEDKAKREVVMNGSAQSAATPTAPPRPATPERPTTPESRDNAPSPRSLRRSPSVRVVDAYGRERVGSEAPAEPVSRIQDGHADAGRKTSSSSQPAPPPTPRSTSRGVVRIVDAMGREVDDTLEIADASEYRADRSCEGDISVVSDDIHLGHADALARIRQTLKDLAEDLSDADRSEDLELNSSHLEQLDDVSKAARLARNQLAQNLQIETAREHDLRRHRRSSVWTSGLLPEVINDGRRPWNRAIVCCSVLAQLILILAMWRYAHIEARRLFYTTYYDPLYPELTPLQGSSYFSGTLSTSRPWTVLDSYETIRQEGWMSIWKEVLRMLGHVGDQAWERWGDHAHFEKPT
ncbi:hypothetical protein BS17DRAFT_775245 [Gyrodon lividus]|nr:hypothetical protein BS17DRAFT_775245 [Gyrodon lividus]